MDETAGYYGEAGESESAAYGETAGYEDAGGYAGNYDASSESGYYGEGASDPYGVTDSVAGGLADAGISLANAQGHLAHGIYDTGAANVHAAEAMGDAYAGDREGVLHRMDQADADAHDAVNQFQQAGQDLGL